MDCDDAVVRHSPYDARGRGDGDALRKISRLDDHFWLVVAHTKALGHGELTVALFFTDHGKYLDDHGMIERWPSRVSDSLAYEPIIVGGAGLPGRGL
ncbi:uncharacterized protein ColSpa_12574 [Colletotrichum spaethianum]|uniref:Sulfatase N-terminal domain-containing protein n=1 Tax=Colletotrichum spaethianum TaxID=700344 RepID=A0AA37PHQ5_9PEZI|nr:uncharacterized protein ColSpa_12574 [Colletotrichum spaethianum]GKT52393.1 hypothetical protein ColSpa_12574 [Colletotrichum spaethianum]